MCGRTSLYRDPIDIEDAFDAAIAFDYRPRYNIAPREDLAVITADADETITAKEWGLVAPWADDPDDGPRPINARAETVAEKSMFAEAFAERRCLVLADGFYEWHDPGRGQKQPYRIHRGDEPFAFAGVWNRFEANGDTLDTVAIITTEANAVVEPIHDRMPVILGPGTEREWLHADTDVATTSLEPYGGDDLEAYSISTRVNDPSFDDPAVLVETSVGEQSGLGDFAG